MSVEDVMMQGKEMTHVTFEQCMDLMLNYFCLPQKSFFYCQSLHPTLSASHIVGLCILEGTRTRDEIIGVSSNIMTLRLYCDINMSVISRADSDTIPHLLRIH